MHIIHKLKKQIFYKVDKLKRLRHWPKNQYYALRKLYNLIGAKGLFWYMPHQGRWPFNLCFTLSILSLGGIYFALRMIIAPEVSLFLKPFVIPFILFGFFMHYALWRSAGLKKASPVTYGTRLYTATIMLLTALLSLFLILKGFNYIVFFLGNSI